VLRSVFNQGSDMSQHYFETKHNGKDVIVQLGYDRPIGHIYMVIQTSSGEDDPIYSNLFQADPFDLTLTDYRAVLADLKITVPESMFTAVEADRLANAGNRVVWHVADGSPEVW
jgi:hypothetical protein